MGHTHAAMGDDPLMAAPDAQLLVVEDDEVVATFLVELLGRLGSVHWTTTAEQALTVTATRDWDVVISDIDLPGMNGLEFLGALRAGQPLVAALVLSGHSSFDHAVAALRAGADDYLTKPVDPVALLEKARAMIAVTRERRAKGQEVVLAVGAHPDDVEIGVGGVLLRHAAQGHRVTILTLTGGEQGGVAADRAQESRRAADLLSARLVHADLEDTSVSEGGRTIETIRRVIEEIRPTTVYTHTIRDVHQDHRNAHNATLVAARGISRVFCYQAPSSTVDFHPTRFVAIDEYLDRKIEVIQAYASQVAVRGYLDEELLRSTARYWGRFTQARYVEPLEIVRDSDAPTAPPAARMGTDLHAGAEIDVALTTPRVLVTGVGGPSGISILRAMEGEPVTMLGRRHRPVRRRALPRPAGAPGDPAARGPSPLLGGAARHVRAARRAGRRPDGRHRAAPARARAGALRGRGRRARASRRVATLEVCLDKWRLAERCAGRVRVPETRVADAAFDAAAGRAAGDRQAALGQRLARDPARRAARRSSRCSSATARCSSRSTCRGRSTRST